MVYWPSFCVKGGKMRYPDFLPEKGRVGLVAPSFGCASFPYAERMESAVEYLKKEGFDIVEGPNCRLSKGIGKSNSAIECAKELNEFMTEDKSDVVISVGGGELMCEDIPYIDFDKIAISRPKWFMGYSDNTNFSFLLNTICDTASIYGPHIGDFGMIPRPDSVDDALRVLMGKTNVVSNYDMWEKDDIKDEDNPLGGYNLTEPYCQTIAGNKEIAQNFSGRLIGGCLDSLVLIAGSKYDKVEEFTKRYFQEGIIWFMEACDMSVMDIRRALWKLENTGWFNNVRGFVFGRPRLYDDSFGDFDRIQAVTGILGKYNVPIILDTDIGHLPPMMPIISGSYATIHATQNQITIKMEMK